MNLQKKETESLTKAVKYAQQDKELELEVLVKHYSSNPINISKFEGLIGKLKGMRSHFKPKIEAQETLDVLFDKNMRLTINGNLSIRDYCKTNKINGIKPKNIQFITKDRVLYVDVNNYGIRFNLKREKVIIQGNPTITTYVKQWNNIEKIFRYKKRYSFFTKDNLFRFDLTVVKNSTKRDVRHEPSKKKKKDIKYYEQEYYVIKPDYVVNFDDWWSSLKPNEEVELLGKKYPKPIPKKTIKGSNVFTNKPEYEIEIEYIGNKLPKNERPSNKVVLDKLIENTGYVVQSLQNNYFITSKDQKDLVITEYEGFMKDYKFTAPQTVTLELKDIVEREYESYQNVVNIRKGYTVTDKADGERNLLIILKSGGVYMINRKNVVKNLGASIKNMSGTILDGEYITKTKNGKNICLFMVFDMYFYKGTDIRNSVLMRTTDEKNENVKDVSRMEYMNIFFKEYELEHNNPNNNINLELVQKKFLYGNSEPYDTKVTTQINTFKEQLEDAKKNNDKDNIQKLESMIKEYKMDTMIFDKANEIYSKEYIYNIDGLIFTPISLSVGEDPTSDKPNKHTGRWYRSFKWKPSDENSIDFLIDFKKDDNGKDMITYINGRDNTVKPHKILILKVGYDPEQHTKYNACRVMNEDLVFDNRYYPVAFQPTNPYTKDAHLATLPLEGNVIKCEDGTIINEGDIVEFRYIINQNGNNKWIPMRIRDTLSPNDFITAINVWKSIHNPITKEMITTGIITDYTDDAYYRNTNKRSDISTKAIGDFHSFVKKSIITNNSVKGGLLLDMSCGKLGDLNHWLDAKQSMCVGIDISHDNLDNVSGGACNRVLSKTAKVQDILLDNILLIWGDSSKNIRDGRAGRDELNKYYLDIVYGNIDTNSIKNSKLRRFYEIGSVEKGAGFDTVSCQFSIHYFFNTENNINMFLSNVSNSLKTGGKFICTCLDGSHIFSELNNTDKIIEYDTKSNKIAWKITKKYKNRRSTLPNNNESIGYPIDVYVESIGTTTEEYLVHPEYLISKCKEFNMKLNKHDSFNEKYTELLDKDIKYGSAKDMTSGHKKYSFYHVYFIFEKK